jgi:hypothetical protein
MRLLAQLLVETVPYFLKNNMAAGLVSIWIRIRDLSSLNWLHGSICIWICIEANSWIRIRIETTPDI